MSREDSAAAHPQGDETPDKVSHPLEAGNHITCSVQALVEDVEE